MSKIINIRTENINIFGIISNFNSLQNNSIQSARPSRYIFSCRLLDVLFRLIDLETTVIKEQILQTENGDEISGSLIISGSNARIHMEAILGIEFRFRFERLNLIRRVSPGSLIIQENTGKVIGLVSGKFPRYAARMNYIVEAIIEDFSKRNISIERPFDSTEFEEEFEPTIQKLLDDNDYNDLQTLGLSRLQVLEQALFEAAGYSELLPFILASRKSEEATELWFYRSHHFWYWSPPLENGHLNWKRVSDNDDFRVVGGSWDGVECVHRNRNLIQRLRLEGSSYLRQAPSRESYVDSVYLTCAISLQYLLKICFTQTL